MAGIELGISGLDDCRLIGSGGFATVYSALDVRFGRTVAVKVLANVDEAGRRRFDREQLSMGKLSYHLNVVTAFSSGYTAGGQPYLVMEFMSGGSLADRIDKGETLAWDKAARFITAIAKALSHAHGRGILHRDIKPENILLSADGIAKLADFGISSVREGVATQAVGFSLAHAPPETFAGGEDNRDERSDLYSLASSLLTVVKGRPPFESAHSDNSQLAYLVRIKDDPIPRLHDVRYDRFLATAMAKDPNQRFATADQFIKALATTLLPIEDQPELLQPKIIQSISAESISAESTSAESTSAESTSAESTSAESTSAESTSAESTSAELSNVTAADFGSPPRPPSSETAVFEDSTSNQDQPVNANGDGSRPELDQGKPPVTEPRLEPNSSTQPRTETVRQPQPDQQAQARQQAAPQEASVNGQHDNDGPFETAATIVANPPWPEKVEKDRQKGVIAAAVIGLLAIALFLAYLLRPVPETTETINIEGVESTQPVDNVPVEGEPELGGDADDELTDGPAAVTGGPHTGSVTDLVKLDDGRFISSSEDGTVLVWNPTDDQSEPTGFVVGTGLAVTRSFALNDGRVVSRQSDDSAIIWNPDDLGSPPLKFEGRASDGGFAETDNGRIISVDPTDKGLIVWDPDDAGSVTAIESDGSVETFEPAVQIAYRDNAVVTASKDLSLSFWTIDDEAGTGSWVPDALVGTHDGTINDVLILADGTVASVSDDGTVLLQAPGGGDDAVFVFDKHLSKVFDLVQFEDGRVGSGGSGSSIVWNPANPKWVANEEKTGIISRLSTAREQVIMSDDRLAIVNRKEVVVWNPNLPSPSPIVSKSDGSKTHDENVTAVLALDDGKLVSADEAGNVLIWDPDDNE